MDPLTGKLLLAAAQGAGKELVQFVGPLVGLVSAQKKVLDEIQQDVKALVEGPFETAQEYVQDALLAVSNETQEEYLMRADEQFVLAAAQQTDLLKKSYAWTGSAIIKAHLRPAEKAIITRHFRNAYTSGVQAGQKTADPAPKDPPGRVARSARWLGKMASSLGPARIAMGRRTQSVRVSSVMSVSVPVPRGGSLQFETYMATKSAKERERRLVEINSHVCALREILISCGVSESEVPAYRVRLEAGPRITYDSWPHTETTYWALVFETAPSGEDIAQCDSTVMLSDGRKLMNFDVQR
jgi:hypothetical protein